MFYESISLSVVNSDLSPPPQVHLPRRDQARRVSQAQQKSGEIEEEEQTTFRGHTTERWLQSPNQLRHRTKRTAGSGRALLNVSKMQILEREVSWSIGDACDTYSLPTLPRGGMNFA